MHQCEEQTLPYDLHAPSLHLRDLARNLDTESLPSSKLERLTC